MPLMLQLNMLKAMFTCDYMFSAGILMMKLSTKSL